MLVDSDSTAVLNYILWDYFGHAQVVDISSSLPNPPKATPPSQVSSTTPLRKAATAAVGHLADPWSMEVLKAIAAHRHLEKGWDGEAAEPPAEAALDTAEELVHAFAAVPSPHRPTFAVDSEGRPSFSIYDGGLYLHLTVDRPGAISWYRVLDSEQTFGEHLIDADGGLSVSQTAKEILAAA